MESEKVEEKPPSEQTQPQTSEAPPKTEEKKTTSELTQEKKDECKK